MSGRSACRRARADRRDRRRGRPSPRPRGATTVPMSRPSITTSPSAPSSRWRSRITSRTSGWRATTGHHPVDPHLPDRVGDVGAVDEARGPASSKTTGCSPRERAERGAVAERRARGGARARSGSGTSRRCRGSGSRAAPRAPRATVLLPAPAGPSIATIIGASGRLVQRMVIDDCASMSPVWTRSASRSKKPGKLIAAHSAPSIRRPPARRRPRSRRASRSGGRRRRRSCRRAAAPGRRGPTKPSGRASMCTPIARSAVVTVSIRSVSFARSSSAPVTRVVAVRERAEQRDERQLVDEPRHLARARSSSRRAASPATSRSATASPATVRRLKIADARAHPLEHVEEARCGAG